MNISSIGYSLFLMEQQRKKRQENNEKKLNRGIKKLNEGIRINSKGYPEIVPASKVEPARIRKVYCESTYSPNEHTFTIFSKNNNSPKVRKKKK